VSFLALVENVLELLNVGVFKGFLDLFIDNSVEVLYIMVKMVDFFL